MFYFIFQFYINNVLFSGIKQICVMQLYLIWYRTNNHSFNIQCLTCIIMFAFEWHLVIWQYILLAEKILEHRRNKKTLDQSRNCDWTCIVFWFFAWLQCMAFATSLSISLCFGTMMKRRNLAICYIVWFRTLLHNTRWWQV